MYKGNKAGKLPYLSFNIAIFKGGQGIGVVLFANVNGAFKNKVTFENFH
jgi:hypothetical protein